MHHRKNLRVTSAHYHAAHLVHFMAANEQGFFAEEGLTAEDWDLVYPGGIIPSVVEPVALHLAMKERGIDIVTDAKPESVLSQNARGTELYIIGGWRNASFQHGLFGGPRVQRVEDLVGKRLGTRDLGGLSYVFTKFMLNQAGIDPYREVEWVRGIHSATESYQALKDGRVDAVLARSQGRRRLEDEGYPLLFDSAQFSPQGFPVRLMAATGRVLREHSDLVRAFLRGAIRAYWFYRNRANFDFIRDIETRMRRMHWDEEEADLERHSSESITAPEQLERDAAPVDGGVPIAGLEVYLDHMKALGEVPQDYRLKQALRLDLVTEAFQELEGRPELRPELERVRAVAAQVSY